MPLLELDNVHSYYGHIQALRGISLTVEEGEVVTLIGSNGAGKTTTLRSIHGILPPREGRILFAGEEIQGTPAHDMSLKGISQSPEGRKIFHRMTVRENLEMGAYHRSDRSGAQEDMDRVFELFPRLEERIKQEAGTMSGGEQQMLAIGRALMSRPKLLLLDEPSMGLAPVLVERIFQTISGDQQAGNDHTPRRAERQRCPRNSLPRLRTRNRHHSQLRLSRKTARGPQGPRSVPRRDLRSIVHKITMCCILRACTLCIQGQTASDGSLIIRAFCQAQAARVGWLRVRAHVAQGARGPAGDRRW